MANPGSTVLLGGARSGKSDLAVRMARAWGDAVTVVATAEPFDSDMAQRIDRHQQDRPSRWGLVEEPVDVAVAVRGTPAGDFVVIDCLTVWVATLLHREKSELEIMALVDDLLAAIRVRSAPTVIVSNEVGLGLHPETELERMYRDILGRVNQRVVAGTDRAFLLVAGRAVPLLDSGDLL